MIFSLYNRPWFHQPGRSPGAQGRESYCREEAGSHGVDYAILLADVSGSTKIYERVGDEAASKLVFECVERMQRVAERNDGVFVRSKGDDVLCLFRDVQVAIATAGDIVEQGTLGAVSVHAGLHWGTIVWRGSETFGGSINIAARLAGRANENEVLISETIVERLPEAHDIELRPMGPMALRGAAEPLNVYALVVPSQDLLTRQIFRPTADYDDKRLSQKGTVVELSYADRKSRVTEGAELTVGRSPHCDLVIADDLVSRIHASISVRHGLAELTDRSSGGSTVRFKDGGDFYFHRQSAVLTGGGSIILGDSTTGRTLPEITFDVVQSD